MDGKDIGHLAALLKDNCPNSPCMASESNEMQSRMNAMEGKPIEAASTAVQPQANVSDMVKERDASTADFGVLALKIECMRNLVGEAKSLCPRVVELEKAVETKELKVWAKSKTANIELASEQASTKRAENMDQIAQLELDLHEINGKLNFSKRCNDVGYARYSILSDERDLLKCQMASGGVCIEVMIQQLAKGSKNVDASINDLSRQATHAQKAI